MREVGKEKDTHTEGQGVTEGEAAGKTGNNYPH